MITYLCVAEMALQFYQDFDVLMALPAIIATIVLTSDKVPDQRKSVFSDLATGLLGSTVVSSIIGLAFNKMVLSRPENHATRELWSSSRFIDVSMVKLMGGLLAWSVDRFPPRVTAILWGEVFVLLLVTITLSSTMWPVLWGRHQELVIEK